MTAEDTCITCAGLNYPCDTCGLLIVWNVSGTCQYCQEETAKQLAKELKWWHEHRKERKVA